MMVEMKKGQNDFVGSVFGIFRGFVWVRSSVLINEPGFGRVRSFFFQICSWVRLRSGRTSSKFGLFEGVRSSVLVAKSGFE